MYGKELAYGLVASFSSGSSVGQTGNQSLNSFYSKPEGVPSGLPERPGSLTVLTVLGAVCTPRSWAYTDPDPEVAEASLLLVFMVNGK